MPSSGRWKQTLFRSGSMSTTPSQPQSPLGQEQPITASADASGSASPTDMTVAAGLAQDGPVQGGGAASSDTSSPPPTPTAPLSAGQRSDWNRSSASSITPRTTPLYGPSSSVSLSRSMAEMSLGAAALPLPSSGSSSSGSGHEQVGIVRSLSEERRKNDSTAAASQEDSEGPIELLIEMGGPAAVAGTSPHHWSNNARASSMPGQDHAPFGPLASSGGPLGLLRTRERDKSVDSRLSDTSPRSRERSMTTSTTDREGSIGNKPTVLLGVAAMDRKARSKPMQNILNRLMAYPEVDIQIVMFGDKTLIDEPPESWPVCDVLISFFSSGFPIDKAIAYVDLRKPICVNDLRCQKVLWDRRTVLAILDKCGVPTPRRIEVDRDTGPTFEREIMKDLKKRLGITFKPRATVHDVKLKDEDTIVVDGKEMKKPFVEKPVSGEDHNIHIYFSKKQGGGGRRLFRKIGNKSSEFDPNLTEPRLEGSYIYEEFLAVDNAEDIKVYTIGPYFVHAETRKSPVVDGVVKRNPDGKEIRYIIKLSKEEVKIATSISKAFKQNICGFDLLRVAGKSYVIDVNGWSFVKGNDYYYDRCAEILGKFCKAHIPNRPHYFPTSISTSSSGLGLGVGLGGRPTSSASNYRQFGSPSTHHNGAGGSGTGTFGEKEPSSWQLKANVTVFRHGDRTPKQKLKRSFKVKDPWTAPLIALLQGRREEIILRTGLELVSDAAAEAMRLPGANMDDLNLVIEVINRKKMFDGTKVQIKPSFQKDREDGELEKVQLIIKWGGEFSHAAKYQAKDYGMAMRRDMMIMNEAALRNTTVYTSSERRVTASADIFTASFLSDLNQSDEPLNMIIDRALLDDSNAAKDLMDKVKKRLKASLRGDPEVAEINPDFWPEGMPPPAQLVLKIGQLIKMISGFMRINYERLDVDKIQRKWCTHETPALYRERWEKLFKDFDESPYDPSRISELYDMLSHDGIHNRPFLLAVFADPQAEASKAHDKLHELYNQAYVLFGYVCPREYGITPQEKERIGLLTSLPLLQSITENLRAAQDSKGACAFYFTKESHIHTLLNLILASDLPIIMERTPPLDYFSSITFEVYERSTHSGSNSTHATPSVTQSPRLALMHPTSGTASDTASIGSEHTGMTGATQSSSIRPPPERSLIISVSEGAHSSNILSMSLDARHALVPQRPRHLTTHIDYEDAMLKLEAHAKREERIECDRRLIEGQTVFGGVPVPDRETMRVKQRSNSVGSSVRSSQGGFGRSH